MQHSFALRIVSALAGALASAAAFAQAIPAGTYAVADSGYSITVQPRGADLAVTEAGKVRIYAQAGPGSYRYRSDITGATYELRYRDRGSLSALKLGSGNAPTLLFRQGGPAPETAAAPASPTAPAAAPAVTPALPAPSPHLAVAEKYQALALTDTKDVQSWAFCSAAALKRSMATQEEADAYGREAAAKLATIAVDPARNPCPDAIPAALWPSAAGDAEAPALKAANAEALAAAARQRAEIAAMKARQAEDQAAFERARAEHQAALAKAEAAQADYAREQAAYQAAVEEYRRQVEALKGTKPGG